MPVDLSEDIREALAARPGKTLTLVDPSTRENYVLVRREAYNWLRAALEGTDDEAFERARLHEATLIRRAWA